MLRPNKSFSINEFIRKSKNGVEDLKRSVFAKVNEIEIQISTEAIYTDKEKDIAWIGISLDGTDEYRWNVTPLSNNLYDGLAGISLFLNAFDSVKQGDNNKICTMLNQTLFQYTNSRLDGNNYDHKNESNGAFSGDSSLMYLLFIFFKHSFLNSINKQKNAYTYSGHPGWCQRSSLCVAMYPRH